MIAFTCSRCGMKLKVKEKFAGRSSKCPTCKHPLIVPAPTELQTYVPLQQIDGTPSSIVRAGIGGGVSLDEAARPGQPAVHELLARQTQKGERYLIAGEIARGGMGAVLRAVDCDIRREVAVKFMLDPGNPKKKLRFIEEAQITGQLEHPNIVPIHELATDAQGRLFFSMKIVQGRSLAEILEDLRQNAKKAEKEYTLGRLLNVLVNVCHALAYAHSRGVVHRDLKPANIMVGDFGEVYLMDWGLAKVLKGGPVDEAPFVTFMEGAPPAAAPATGAPTKRSTKVVTSLEPETDLTQDGAILGTPVYMPPEQASGNQHAIDARSDIYSLGAILYEILTLLPPIEKEGGYMAVLMRVVAGEIVAPELRNPARAWKIPKELSAVARKALARLPEERYQSVEALRRDIERFQEGRSVSAKQDTFKETVWKFVKRNQAVSAALFVLLPILVVVLGVALQNYLAYKSGEAELATRTRNAVPALTAAARQIANAGNRKEALDQIELTLLYEPKDADAHLLRGQLLLAQKDWARGRGDLEQYLQQRPNDVEAKKLLELCRTGKVDDSAVLWDVAGVLERQNVSGLAIPLVQEVQQTVQARKPLATLYQKQIETNWRDLGRRVSLDPNGQLSLDFTNCKQVTSLGPLQGMRWNSLSLWNCPVTELTPLHGMPLATLNLNYTAVADLSPLEGMPLGTLHLAGCPVRDLSPLHGMKLTTLNLGSCSQVSDLTPLEGMPLTWLNLEGCNRVRDLTPLHGMPLTALNINGCALVQDLTPLQGMKLTSLNLFGFSLMRDLTPLKGMPLNALVLQNCGLVRDLTPLQGMPLTSLNLLGCGQVRDLTPLRGMKLTTLTLWNCGLVEDLTPLKDMPLASLDLNGCALVRDLTPLQGMNLTEVILTPKNITKGMGALRQMKSLAKINGLAAGDFWKKYDAGEFK